MLLTWKNEMKLLNEPKKCCIFNADCITQLRAVDERGFLLRVTVAAMITT